MGSRCWDYGPLRLNSVCEKFIASIIYLVFIFAVASFLLIILSLLGVNPIICGIIGFIAGVYLFGIRFIELSICSLLWFVYHKSKNKTVNVFKRFYKLLLIIYVVIPIYTAGLLFFIMFPFIIINPALLDPSLFNPLNFFVTFRYGKLFLILIIILSFLFEFIRKREFKKIENFYINLAKKYGAI